MPFILLGVSTGLTAIGAALFSRNKRLQAAADDVLLDIRDRGRGVQDAFPDRAQIVPGIENETLAIGAGLAGAIFLMSRQK